MALKTLNLNERVFISLIKLLRR